MEYWHPTRSCTPGNLAFSRIKRNKSHSPGFLNSRKTVILLCFHWKCSLDFLSICGDLSTVNIFRFVGNEKCFSLYLLVLQRVTDFLLLLLEKSTFTCFTCCGTCCGTCEGRKICVRVWGAICVPMVASFFRNPLCSFLVRCAPFGMLTAGRLALHKTPPLSEYERSIGGKVESLLSALHLLCSKLCRSSTRPEKEFLITCCAVFFPPFDRTTSNPLMYLLIANMAALLLFIERESYDLISILINIGIHINLF